MFNQSSLDRLWNGVRQSQHTFDLEQLSGIPDSAVRHLQHCTAPHTRVASAVRLQMHGEIKLRDWCPFSAEEVIVWTRGFIWRATVQLKGIPIRDSDRLLDGRGATSWKLLGFIPVVSASGPDITRSAVGRVNIESIRLPSVLASGQVKRENETE